MQPSRAKVPCMAPGEHKVHQDLGIPCSCLLSSPKGSQRAQEILYLFEAWGGTKGPDKQKLFTTHLTALHGSITKSFTLKIPVEVNPGEGGLPAVKSHRGFTGSGIRDMASRHLPSAQQDSHVGAAHASPSLCNMLSRWGGRKGNLVQPFPPAFIYL